MQKFCGKHGLYPYSDNQCPYCYQDKQRNRDNTDSPYDYRWRKWRQQLRQDMLYSFCWLTFLEENKFNYDVHYHHLIPITKAPELQFEKYNVVPLTGEYHGKVEAHPEQYDFKSIKKAVMEKLKNLLVKT